MKAMLIDGKKIAGEVLAEVERDVQRLKEERGVQPGLAVILVGENPASQVYVRNKTQACAKAGIFSQQYNLPGGASEAEVLELIDTLNHQENIHGILIQSPLPKPLNEDFIFNAVDPRKDVDGFIGSTWESSRSATRPALSPAHPRVSLNCCAGAASKPWESTWSCLVAAGSWASRWRF